MWPVDANVFIIRLMRLVLERKGIQWSASRCLVFHPLPYRREDGYLESCSLSITVALEKLSSIEYQWDVEEYEHLCTMLGPSAITFRDFFSNSVSRCYLKHYSPFNFLRYLRYIIDFTLFCFYRGYPDTVNQAAISISKVIVRNEDVFKVFANWRKLRNEAERILRSDFVHPYIDNEYFKRRNASQRRHFIPGHNKR